VAIVTTAVQVRRSVTLTPAEIDEVMAIAGAAGDADGVYPLSEHVVLHLRDHAGSAIAHLLIRADGAELNRADGAELNRALLGYANVDTSDTGDGAVAELVVHPMHRRRGLGRALVTEAMTVADELGDGRLRLWAHGDHPSATALAVGLGFDRARVLWQMRRSLTTPLPEPVFPPGVGLRAYRPGADDDAWVALNAAAFAGHPEQGAWTIDDLRTRLRQPWFDPAGFLLAERDGELLGFHWTKIHGEPPGRPAGTAPHPHAAIGEVYVLGVAPAANGTGLGTALTLAGLHHLRSRGLDRAMLYVDESNTRAAALYRRLGFVTWSTDVAFRRIRPADPQQELTGRRADRT
jgi:mycothiol synthase